MLLVPSSQQQGVALLGRAEALGQGESVVIMIQVLG